MSHDFKRDGHLAMAAGNLTLAAIEQQLRDEGYMQSEIDGVLAFVIKIREELAARGELPKRDQRPS
jgi:hypothetical protein